MLIMGNNKCRLAPRVEKIEERGEVKTSSMFRCFGSFSLCIETDQEKANRSAALSLRGSSTRRRAVDEKNCDSLPLRGSPRRRREAALSHAALSLSVAPTRRQATAFSQWRAVDDKNADSLPLCGSPRQRQTAISPRI